MDTVMMMMKSDIVMKTYENTRILSALSIHEYIFFKLSPKMEFLNEIF